MGYFHVDVTTVQTSKHNGQPCGDVAEVLRTRDATTIVLADGLGSGVRAHLSAQFTVSRLLEKLQAGASARKAFGDVVQTLETNRGTDMPWAAFCLVRVLPEGNTTILSYEMPHPLLIARRHAHLLPQQSLSSGQAIITQANCCLVPGDSLLMVSDGVTQAGIGHGLALGWTAEGVRRELDLRLARGTTLRELPELIHRKAGELDGNERGDDTTVVLASCRNGVVVNVLTGPPQDPSRDSEIVRSFLDEEGVKVVCGGTTTGVVARELDTAAIVDTTSLHRFTPPRYEVEGIDLATEGAICLNQLYNIWDEPRFHFEERSAVSDLYELLQSADRVRLTVGTAANPASLSSELVQQGILTRPKIVPLLAEKLRAAGKLVELLWV